jgi:hypothetical protein
MEDENVSSPEFHASMCLQALLVASRAAQGELQ